MHKHTHTTARAYNALTLIYTGMGEVQSCTLGSPLPTSASSLRTSACSHAQDHYL